MANTTKVKKVEILSKEVCIDFSELESLKILLNTFLEFSLYENKEISVEEYQNIKEKDLFFRLKDYAYYLLKFRDYCEKEMENSLYKYHQNMDYVNQIILELKNKNYLNDESYAKYACEKMFNKQYSKARAYKELDNMEISEDIIDDVLKDYDEYEILKKKISFLFNISYKKKTLDNAKKDVYQKCLMDGFDSTLIIEILENINIDYEEKNVHDQIMLEKDYNKLKRNYQNDCDKKDFQVKLIRKLTTKGYSYDAIMELIRKDELNND